MSKLHLPVITSKNLERINPVFLPLPWIVVIVLVIIFATLKYSHIEDAVETQQAVVKAFPQTYINDVNVRQYDENGALHYQMESPLIRSFQPKENPSAEDYSLFETPSFVLVSDPQKPRWFVTAKEGRLDEDSIWFTLTQNVIAHNTSEKQGELTIMTTDLRLNTQEKFAETDKAVTMRGAKSEITGVGMRADINRDHIELKSHVKGTYEP